MEFDFYEHIDGFMNGSLSDELMEKMNAAIKADNSLKTAIENYADAQSLSEGLLELDVLETIEKLESSDSTNTTNMKDKKKGSAQRLWILLAILAVASLGYWFLPSNDGSTNNQEQFASNYERPINDNATKSATGEASTDFEEGKRLFDLNKFDEAEKILEQAAIKNLDPEKRSDIHFWLAHAQYQIKDFANARLNATISNHKDADKLIEQIRLAVQKPASK